MDVDDDVYDDDEGRCFKSKPAALRHAAHIFFFLLLVLEWYSFVSMLRFVRSAMNARGGVLKRVVTNGANEKC